MEVSRGHRPRNHDGFREGAYVYPAGDWPPAIGATALIADLLWNFITLQPEHVRQQLAKTLNHYREQVLAGHYWQSNKLLAE